MKTAHQGLGITEEEWNQTLAHIAASLDAVGVADNDKVEFLECAAGLKPEIVEAGSPA